MNTKLKLFIINNLTYKLTSERKRLLDEIIFDLNVSYSRKENLLLNFICTHNSRRSQFAQVWAWILANYYELPFIETYSGGTEVTAVYPTVISTLEYIGLDVIRENEEEDNPVFVLSLGEELKQLNLYSKLYDIQENPKDDFFAFMTCSSADEGCPFVAGAIKKYRLTYEDPKFSDGTNEENTVYLNKCIEIGSELKYVFEKLTKLNTK